MEDGLQRQRMAEGLANPGQQAHGEQGVATELEEVLLSTHRGPFQERGEETA